MSVKPVSGPHVLATRRSDQIMRLVILAMAPSVGFGVLLFGWPALYLLVVTVFSALAFEAFCLKLKGVAAGPYLRDGSAIVSGLLVAMTLPPWAPWWIGVVGAGIAIVLGKHVYGGLGQNLFNPAMLARVALLISFPIEMTTWANVSPLFTGPGVFDSFAITFSGLSNADAVTGATTLGLVKTEFSQGHVLPGILNDYSGFLAMLGWERGSLGETSTLLILGGGLWLMRQGVIQWHIPVSLLATIFLLSSGFHLWDAKHYLSPWVHLNSGAVMLVAFFIATDYVTSPNTPQGQVIFGAGCGLLIFVIRSWGGYPEGTGFAILLMNAVTPLIDHYIRPRIYGRYRSGKPLDISNS
ncbi:MULTISPECIES: RnfABCDGE type electron transport complex subunit D [Methylomonas]|uniref:Ion-translocating oxidoreductase complex subunit D n=1 Tax=Methylomonas koyamae TaxID=702114 RepID=A0A177PFQ3_9GAMM|nr:MULTISPECIES: RnfABCDGE type electron transport complex subunit D [Methylomonas]NJA07038.1 RnfABCDGE type electron transport complex subunit D [Methylococcaceae bacterium WWC4]OAI28200.1 electron transporter RnfD [Methylomonas koyamae]OHX38418.1 electron transporter RnfD [Methylomonas sp. LWB]WGS87175.1 RnfABCDGE type electron transport complex subunit D [Methylomonas sp. UP202]